MADRTKLWIAEKMREIMNRKPIEKIRVTEICAAAEIERSTFYYHFRDKYDLVAWVFFQVMYQTNIIDLHESSEAMKKIKSDILFYRRALKDTSQNALWQYMLEYFADKYAQLAREMSGTDALDAQILFTIRLYCYGIVGMMTEWCMQDNLASAETMVEMMFTSMPEVMRRIYSKEAKV